MTIRDCSSNLDGQRSPAALYPHSSLGGTAWLTVEAEARPSRSFPIESSVVRVGSHPTCAVQLDEGEPHALTVERRSNGYRVYNRTDRSLSLAGEPLLCVGDDFAKTDLLLVDLGGLDRANRANQQRCEHYQVKLPGNNVFAMICHQHLR